MCAKKLCYIREILNNYADKNDVNKVDSTMLNEGLSLVKEMLIKWTPSSLKETLIEWSLVIARRDACVCKVISGSLITRAPHLMSLTCSVGHALANSRHL